MRRRTKAMANTWKSPCALRSARAWTSAAGARRRESILLGAGMLLASSRIELK